MRDFYTHKEGDNRTPTSRLEAVGFGHRMSYGVAARRIIYRLSDDMEVGLCTAAEAVAAFLEPEKSNAR